MTNNNTRKYRVKSKFKFIVFLVVMISLVTLTSIYMVGNNKVWAETDSGYKTIQVGSGDTLWTIAKTNMDNSNDIRKNIFIISKINKVSAEELTPGMTLKIPTE